MEILGEKWTVVVLREIFVGIRRFDDMRVRTGIPRQMLTNRLATLVEHGVLRREPYREPGARAREEYRLTQQGLDLYPALLALLEWGDRYLADPGGPPLTSGIGVARRSTPCCAARLAMTSSRVASSPCRVRAFVPSPAPEQ
jgi:DNA-binding HxlR family transcriptional regulator